MKRRGAALKEASKLFDSKKALVHHHIAVEEDGGGLIVDAAKEAVKEEAEIWTALGSD